MNEAVEFKCDVWAYPYAERLEIYIDHRKISSTTEGIVPGTFQIDTLTRDSTQIKNHFAKFEVANMSGKWPIAIYL